jgi:hypothetical protein
MPHFFKLPGWHPIATEIQCFCVSVAISREASGYFKKARTNNVLSNIPGAAGGFLVGFELRYMLGGQEINWSVFGAGIVLVGFSIPLISAARKMHLLIGQANL